MSDEHICAVNDGNMFRCFSHVRMLGVRRAADNLQKLQTLIRGASLYPVEGVEMLKPQTC